MAQGAGHQQRDGRAARRARTIARVPWSTAVPWNTLSDEADPQQASGQQPRVERSLSPTDHFATFDRATDESQLECSRRLRVSPVQPLPAPPCPSPDADLVRSVVVCQFYLRGTCKFGASCKNEHPQAGGAQLGGTRALPASSVT